ncbi:MAG: hypothetical protein ACI9QQ_000035, partial [Myxococcota bacterium]
MARSKTANRRTAAAGDSFAARVTNEAMGLLLVGFGLLATLALSTYSPTDPIFELGSVNNRIGPVGATLAGSLLGLLGYGAMVAVAVAGWLGGRLLLGHGVPDARARFWPGSILLMLGVTTLPLVLHHLAPGRLGAPLGGRLGEFLVAGEEVLLGEWGALLISSSVLVVGVLGLLGIPTGRAMTATASGAALAGRFAADGLVATAAALRRILEPIAAAVPGVTGAVTGWFGEVASKDLKKNKRREEAAKKKAKKAAASKEGAEAEQEWEEVEEGEEGEWEYEDAEGEEGEEEEWEYAEGEEEGEEEEEVAEKPAKSPHIVDHEKDRAKSRKPSQEAFEFNADGPLG